MKSFLFWMAAASGLGFVKVIALSWLLAPAAFGNYAAVVGASAFLTMLLSFGLIEATIKRFPRLWVDGAKAEIVGDAQSITGSVLRRTLLVAAAAIAGTVALGRSEDLLPVALGMILGGVGLLTRLKSAIILATGSSRLLLSFTLTRATAAAILALTGGWAFGWMGAIGGELLAAVVTIVQANLSLRPHLGRAAASRARGEVGIDGKLYAAGILTATTMMADRSAIGFLSGAAMAGSYGFAMVLPQAGQVITNIIGQRVGPTIIRGHKLTGRVDHAMLLKAAAATLVGSVCLTLLSLAAAPLAPGLLAKYGVDAVTIILAGLVCAAFFHVVLEYALIALNREGAVLAASCAATATFAAGLLLADDLNGYLTVALATRAVQTFWLSVALLRR